MPMLNKAKLRKKKILKNFGRNEPKIAKKKFSLEAKKSFASKFIVKKREKPKRQLKMVKRN